MICIADVPCVKVELSRGQIAKEMEEKPCYVSILQTKSLLPPGGKKTVVQDLLKILLF